MVFKLGARGALPEAPPLVERPLDPPPFTGTEAQALAGARAYGRYCSVCHGDAAVAGALNPDLRHSGVLNSPQVMKGIVIDGILAHRGMVSFAPDLDEAKVEAIRHYLVRRANEDLALQRQNDGTRNAPN